MKHQSSTRTASLAFSLVIALFAAPVAGQSQSDGSKKWTAPRAPDGHPDLQGIWTNATITPLERPAELAGKAFFTEQEAADYEKRVARENNRDRRSSQAEVDVK